MDLKKLRYDEFERVVGVLLKRLGYRILSEPGRPGTRGPDFETLSPAGQQVIVEVKHLNERNRQIHDRPANRRP